MIFVFSRGIVLVVGFDPVVGFGGSVQMEFGSDCNPQRAATLTWMGRPSGSNHLGGDE